MHGLGDELFARPEDQGTVGMAATKKGDEIAAIVYNQQIEGDPVETEQVTISFEHCDAKEAYVTYVDDTHGNAAAAYDAMGRPEYPSLKEIAELKNVSEIKKEILPITKDNDTVTVELTLLPHAAALVELK